jgi:hypothetical protein
MMQNAHNQGLRNTTAAAMHALGSLLPVEIRNKRPFSKFHERIATCVENGEQPMKPVIIQSFNHQRELPHIQKSCLGTCWREPYSDEIHEVEAQDGPDMLKSEINISQAVSCPPGRRASVTRDYHFRMCWP